MNENTYRQVDTFTKIISALTVLIGVIYTTNTINNYYTQRFYDEKLKVYSEITECVSIISNVNPDSLEFKKAVEKFNILYFGKTHIFEDKEVENIMVLFKEKFEKDTGKYSHSINPQLRDISLQLSKICKEKLARK